MFNFNTAAEMYKKKVLLWGHSEADLWPFEYKLKTIKL